MKTNSALKQEAYASLNGQWGRFAVISLLYFLVCLLVPNAFACIFAAGADETAGFGAAGWLSGFIAMFLLLPLQWAYYVIFLRNISGRREAARTANLFDGYRDFPRIAPTLLLQAVYTALWSLLLVIPGIIKQYSYRMTAFVLEDRPELKYNGAIERSMKLMKGHKMKLFLLDLSFIGWFLLCVPTFGIGLLWVFPYYWSSQAAFYRSLLAEEEAAQP